MNQKETFIDYLKPESPFEVFFFNAPEFIEGLQWGKPRKGHPEGAVYKHIKHVLANIDKLKISLEEKQVLRICALVHDTFKYKEIIGSPRDWSKHHAVYAYNFLKNFTQDETLLGITKWHDEAYYCWRDIQNNQGKELCEVRLNTLYKNIKEYIQLYYLFFICDTMTGDKNQTPIHWFEDYFKSEIQIVKF